MSSLFAAPKSKGPSKCQMSTNQPNCCVKKSANFADIHFVYLYLMEWKYNGVGKTFKLVGFYSAYENNVSTKGVLLLSVYLRLVNAQCSVKN
jgi:hypothetical protein